MNLYIDINSRQAVNGIGIASPLPPITFKDQDTPAVNIYFVLEGKVLDEGPGTAIKFGLNLPPPNPISLLVYDTSFVKLTDVNGNVFYQGFPVFYTSQLVAALGTNTSIQCVGEVRTQLSNGEIFRSMDIPFTIWRTILLETTTPPPSIVTVYPDPSVLEIIPHKGQPSGYAGLNSLGLLLPNQIPVGGDIRLSGPGGTGNIQTAYLIDILGANFIQPATLATVNIQVTNSSSFLVGQWIYIPDAGYYGVSAIVDATHISITNLGSLWNEPVSDSILAGLPILSACELGGTGGGGGGGGGANAYTTTSASFTVPAATSNVTVTMLATGWFGGLGYIVFIRGAGYYAVSSIISTTQAILTNLGYPGNAGSGTVIANGAVVTPGGLVGPAGTAGTAGTSGANAYDTTTAAFVAPAVAANVNIAISSSIWLTVGQVLYIAGAGYYSVQSILSPTTFSAQNLGYSGNATVGTNINSGAHVSPAGLQGLQGTGGSGRDSFTNLVSNFTQPNVLANVTINVGTTAWMIPGQTIYIQGGGYYSVSSLTDVNHAVVTNLGYAGNAAPAATITGGSGVGVGPGGIVGPAGVSAGTVTLAGFNMPTANTTVTVMVGATAWLAQGSIVYINTAGYFSVSSITDSTHVVLTNLGYAGNATAGTTIATNVTVVPAGAQGPAGAAGAAGAAGRDGAYQLGYAGNSITGNGGAGTPFVLVGDAAVGASPNTFYRRDGTGAPAWGVLPVASIGAHIETPTAKTYTLDLSASSAYTITSVVIVLGAGTCTAAFQRNGTGIATINAIAVTTTPQTITLSQAVSAGDKITLAISALASPADLQFSMKYQR